MCEKIETQYTTSLETPVTRLEFFFKKMVQMSSLGSFIKLYRIELLISLIEFIHFT